MNRPWGNSNAVGALYRAEAGRFDSAARGVFDGDLVLCVQHTGDHKYDYILVRVVEGRLRGYPDVRIGSYSFHWDPALEISDREYHLLAAGESTVMPAGAR